MCSRRERRGSGFGTTLAVHVGSDEGLTQAIRVRLYVEAADCGLIVGMSLLANQILPRKMIASSN